MSDRVQDGASEGLHIPARAVSVMLTIWSVVLLVAGELAPGSSDDSRATTLAFLFFVLGVALWSWGSSESKCIKWLTVGAAFLLAFSSSILLESGGLLVLLAFPTMLAAALIGPGASAATAAVATLLLVLFAIRERQSDGWTATNAIAILSVWTAYAFTCALGHSARQAVRWTNEYLERARASLEEANKRREELRQALDDLARANAQLVRLNALAQGLRQEAEMARAAKEQFVANVSHELRTPLNMIIGFSEMILESPEMYGRVPPALLADLNVVYRNAEHLSELIDDVLDLSQIESKQMALVKEEASFAEIVDEAVTSVRPLFDSKGLDLHVDVQRDLPPVFCDRTRIREVFLNLLSNAGRFTEHGGVELRVWRDEQDVVVAIKDTGPGIAAGDLDKLFRPFHQVDGSIRRRYGGSGLGLSISKRFVEMHGGRIWVQSQEGKGTTFYFRLPISEIPPAGEEFWRGLYPGWEYVQRISPYAAPRPVVSRVVVLDSGGILHRLLSRYLGGEIIAVSGLDEAMQEISREPTMALVVNESSTDRVLEQLDSYRLPDEVMIIIVSIPNGGEVSTSGSICGYLVKPVSRQSLLGALDQLGVREGTVLIVDDDPDALQLFGRMLASSEHDYRILLARDGDEALQILRECHPDVMLLDLVMPNVNGFRLLAMREGAAWSDVPVIVISARDPTGQPIISQVLTVTRKGGLSVRHLCAGIEAMCRVMSPFPIETKSGRAPSDDPGPAKSSNE